ncbi:putative serine/threonine-protein kinase clkA-like protein [Cladobotryum mycophilum]|uniref:Serine/threonine-protein kinase clkA-like protein n=1 Tax=Cladobotryum mycophilum TaxID=491253 RepID=A0ABR0SE16_9HYPO
MKLIRLSSVVISRTRFPVSSYTLRQTYPTIAASASRRTWLSILSTDRIRNFPNDGFQTVDFDYKIQEETIPGYKAERFYPVKLGEVFKSRYQVLAKLGFGTASTVWLCRDLVYVPERESFLNPQVAISQHLKSFEGDDHEELALLRIVVDDFEITGPRDAHRCLLSKPHGLTLTDFRNLLPGKKLNKRLLRISLAAVSLAVDAMHQANVVYTDLSPNNILFGITDEDDSVLAKIEKDELELPSARKILPDRIIYRSHTMPFTHGHAVICDFRSAVIGEKHTGDVMPGIYRAPEIIMGMEWDCKIDIWSIGVMIWDLFEGGPLFQPVKNGILDDELHLVAMVSLIGPPPKAFLERSENCRRYWDAEGNWIAATPIPDQSLESRETRLEGSDKEMLLTYVRNILR